jgi:hypothetical protein
MHFADSFLYISELLFFLRQTDTFHKDLGSSRIIVFTSECQFVYLLHEGMWSLHLLSNIYRFCNSGTLTRMPITHI